MRGSAAKSYQENWAWKSRLVKWLCIFWPFQSSLFLLDGRKHRNSYLKIIPQWNWRSELDASFCTERVWKPSRIIRISYDEKQKVSYSDHVLKRWLRSEASMNRTNLVIILVSGASAMLYFWQFRPIGFPLQGLKGISWQLAQKNLLQEKNCRLTPWSEEKKRKSCR